jgi:hypothetical protein
MRTTGPTPLAIRIEMEAKLAGEHLESAEQLLLDALAGPVGDNELAARLRAELAQWDALSAGAWTDATDPRTSARRALIYERLGLAGPTTDRLTEIFPVANSDDVIISSEQEVWYPGSVAERPAYYWDHYAAYLEKKNWTPEAIAGLGLAASRVVERLADPERSTAFQSKGLVLGYVQSGKTANFTGVIAKAIDSGYRLIIVLTGTTDLLRAQTQRRIDKELVGKENLLRGVDVNDPDSLSGVDYYGEPDWDAFVSHGVLPSEIGRPDIYRLTTRNGDYKSLKQGIEALDFLRADGTAPLNAPQNLRRVPARIAVIKKNATVLSRLVTDLKKITARLGDIPTLIIDDESDQASVNTSNPAKWVQGQKQRTTINGHISALLGMLPRSQYVGYTATPFANVFVDPSDSADIFPAQFILALERPPGYMGATDFHDLYGVAEDPSYESSNALAYVRDIFGDDDDRQRLREAIDAFVLAGAIKLYRKSIGSSIDIEHHTMLVHESVRNVEQRLLADEVKKIWESGSWFTPAAARRLHQLYENDHLPVMGARHGGEPIPLDFEEVRPFIGDSASRIQGPEGNPVWIVNGDKEVAQYDIDFGARSIWKIFLGGTKLSRGFTIEGLTVSYYRRPAYQADTLMQMGRWFGFRPGYRDLVRLYIGRSDGRTAYDIYLAFEAACRSEETFREEIKRYAELVNGKPQITPQEIPPLVSQHVPWLQPVAPTKRYNAELVERRSPGSRIEPTGYSKDQKDLERNAAVMRPLVEKAIDTRELLMPNNRGFNCFMGIVDHSRVVETLAQLTWAPSDHFAADLRWLERLDDAQIKDWVIVLPQLIGHKATRSIYGLDRSVHERSRRDDRVLFGGIADPKHRLSADRLAGNAPVGDDLCARDLQADRRGAILVYPVFEVKGEAGLPADVTAEDLIMALVIASPQSTGSPDQPLIRFRTIDPTRSSEAIIDIGNS